MIIFNSKFAIQSFIIIKVYYNVGYFSFSNFQIPSVTLKIKVLYLQAKFFRFESFQEFYRLLLTEAFSIVFRYV